MSHSYFIEAIADYPLHFVNTPNQIVDHTDGDQLIITDDHLAAACLLPINPVEAARVDIFDYVFCSINNDVLISVVCV